jgi:hypothetical protein
MLMRKVRGEVIVKELSDWVYYGYGSAMYSQVAGRG